MTEPARCVWCKVAVDGQFELGAACPHCDRRPLLLEGIPEVRQEHSYGNEPTKVPDIAGEGGRAWRIPLEAVVDKRPNASVGSDWLVHAPGSHPLWWWYMIGVVHLRPTAGKPAKVAFPGATHELMFIAISPEYPLPDVDRWEKMHHLEPLDLAEQFIVTDDAQACELGDLIVKHIVFEGASPDQDHRAYWKVAVANTAEHLRLGGHPDGPRSV